MVLSTFNREIYERDLREEGRGEGETLKLISQVCKKLRKSKKPEAIADELEEDVSMINRICEAAEDCGKDYSTERIFKKLKR